MSSHWRYESNKINILNTANQKVMTRTTQIAADRPA